MEAAFLVVFGLFSVLRGRLRVSEYLFGQSRCWQRMENIRDLVYEGWTSKTSKKGKGPGKGKGRLVNKEDVSEDDRSWGKDSVRLRQRIWEELGHSEGRTSAEAEAGGSGLQESFNEDDGVAEEREVDETRMEDDKREVEFGEGEIESTEIKAMDEERKIKRVTKGKTMGEKKIKERERAKERERRRREGT